MHMRKDAHANSHTPNARAACRPRRQAGGAHCAVSPALCLTLPAACSTLCAALPAACLTLCAALPAACLTLCATPCPVCSALSAVWRTCGNSQATLGVKPC